MEVRDQHESKGKTNSATNSLKAHGNNNKGKVKEKDYKGKAKLSPKEIEKYKKIINVLSLVSKVMFMCMP